MARVYGALRAALKDWPRATWCRLDDHRDPRGRASEPIPLLLPDPPGPEGSQTLPWHGIARNLAGVDVTKRRSRCCRRSLQHGGILPITTLRGTQGRDNPDSVVPGLTPLWAACVSVCAAQTASLYSLLDLCGSRGSHLLLGRLQDAPRHKSLPPSDSGTPPPLPPGLGTPGCCASPRRHGGTRISDNMQAPPSDARLPSQDAEECWPDGGHLNSFGIEVSDRSLI